MHTKRQPIVASELYEEATDLYRRAFFPLASTAGGIALVINGLLFLNPDPLVLNVAWVTLVNFFAAATISAALILPMVIELRATGTTSPVTRITGLRNHGKHVVLATIPLALVNGLLVFTILGIALAIFISARFGLLAAAAVVEDQDVTDSLARSWELTQGLLLRTSGVLLGAIAPFVAATVALAWLDLSYRVTFVAITVAEGLVIPFVLVVILLLFEDYRTLESEPDDFGPSISPPKTSL
ncbi:MAG: hypothetical protein O2826_01575 [Chloroflexi bacterium]|nr:hypothetical protein [Chloroflexota bacterium]MDA1173193.1 hypothetical protein [Chloroflexota bacterium]